MSAPDLRTLAGALPAEALSAEGDRTRWAVGGVVPEAVVSPASVEEVRAVLSGARSAGLGVVPLGGATDVGCEPPRGPFVVLSTRRMANVEDYEPDDLTVTAGAGITLGDLAGDLARHGQWLPADPPFAPRRTLGGLVATGAAGPLGAAYGSPRDHVLGVHVITGDGRELKLGGRVMKNVAGFDLVKLMVGSRGTLGVVVSATVRLFPRPAVDRVLVAEADAPGSLLGDARSVATAPLVPASAALVEPGPGAAGAALVIRLQGAPSAVDAEERRIRSVLSREARSVEGDAAIDLLQEVRDHGAGGELAVRAAALPAALPAVLDAVTGAVPGADVCADVMTGRVRASTMTADLDPEDLVVLRRRMGALGGTLVLSAAPAGLLQQVGAYGSGAEGGDRSAELAAALRGRFDPAGTLSPGRFVS